jgi:hypothetical protein
MRSQVAERLLRAVVVGVAATGAMCVLGIVIRPAGSSGALAFAGYSSESQTVLAKTVSRVIASRTVLLDRSRLKPAQHSSETSGLASRWLEEHWNEARRYDPLAHLPYRPPPAQLALDARTEDLRATFSAFAPEAEGSSWPLSHPVRIHESQLSRQDDPTVAWLLEIHDSVGFPFETLSAESYVAALWTSPPHFAEIVNGHLLTDSTSSWAQRTTADLSAFSPLPFIVHWQGVAGNVAVWAFVHYAVCRTALFARSLHRRSRDRCTTCGHQIRGDIRCPECGNSP